MLLILKESDGPLYRRIYHALKSAIRAGRLGPDERLPSTRALAVDLGVSRNTVMLAYEQLSSEGYVVGNHRSATAVAPGALPRTPPAPPRAVGWPPKLSAYGQRLTKNPAIAQATSYSSRPGLRYDFRYGRPALDAFPREVWRRLLAARARRSTLETFGYGPPTGYMPLREALTEYLRRSRGLSCDADQIVIVNGSQQAFDLAARVLVDPGDAVVVEEPHYHGSRMTFEAAGARPIGVPVDGEGLDTAKLPPATAHARVACVTPCHQFPTGVIMPLRRRLALLEWATRTGAWVIEDDYVSEFRYEGRPLEALQALDRTGRVVYIGTFSKTLFPALRLAYLVLPRPLVRPFAAAKWIADRFTAMLGQEALTDFITGGHFERYLRRASNRNASRRRVLIEALTQTLGGRVEFTGENAGVHLLAWLNDVPPGAVESLIARAADAGVGIYSISPYYSRLPSRAGLLFGYASLTEAEIRAGIRRFAAVV